MTKLKAFLLAAAAAVSLSAPASAADLAVKAINALQSAPCTPTQCSGWYLGGSIAGNGTNANIFANGVDGSVFAGGAIPGVQGGYQYAQGNWFFAFEASFGGQVSTTASATALVTGASVSGNQNGLLMQQIVKLGGNLNSLLSSSNQVTLPAALTQYLISPYFFVGVAEHQVLGGFVSGVATGAGATFDISQHWFADLRYTNIQYGASSNGALNFDAQNLVTIGFNYKF